MKKTTITDAQFMAATSQLRHFYVNQDRQKLEMVVQIEVSERIRENVFGFYKRYEKLLRLKECVNQILAFFLAMTVACSVAYGHTFIIEKFGSWLRLESDNNIFFSQNILSGSDTAMRLYEVSLLPPSGYELVEKDIESGKCRFIYQNNQNRNLIIQVFDYRYPMDFGYFNNDEFSTEQGFLDSNRYELLHGTKNFPSNNFIIWNDENQFVVTIDAVLSKEEIIQLYKSMEVK